jgi:altronate dehydratase
LVKYLYTACPNNKYPDILDNLADIDTALSHLGELGAALFNLIVEAASGRRTQNEIIGYTGACDLWMIAPAAWPLLGVM